MAIDVLAKVGGSLFDLPDLGPRLRAWIDLQCNTRVLLVPGGGPAADLVRSIDKLVPLGEERSHWLALRALAFNAHMLAARLPDSVVISEIAAVNDVCRQGQTPILDMHTFAVADESRPDHLPHLWTVTSDSVAARVAVTEGISQLVLLKSCDWQRDDDWPGAARQGIVDAAFPDVVAKAGPRLQINIVNFRQWRPAGASAAPPPHRGP